MSSRVWIRSVLGVSVAAWLAPATPAQDAPASQPANDAQPSAASQPTSSPIVPRPVPRTRRTTTRPESGPASTQSAEAMERLRKMNEATTQSTPDSATPGAGGPSPSEMNPPGASAPAISPGAAAKSQPAQVNPSSNPATRRTRPGRTREEIEQDIKNARERAAASTQPANATGAAVPSGSAANGGAAQNTPGGAEVQPADGGRDVVAPPNGTPGVYPPPQPGTQPNAPAAGTNPTAGATRPTRRVIDASQPPNSPTANPPGVPAKPIGANPAAANAAATPGATNATPLSVKAPPVDADGRSEWFSYKDTPWEEIVRQIARRLGKPLMDNDVIVSGTLTYETKRKFTFQEALDELNFLLVQQGYFVQEATDYVYLVPMNELMKFLDPRTQMFGSWDEFTDANLRDAQLCSTVIKVEDRSAEQVRDMLGPAMPDYALPVVVGNSNSIRISGLAKDVRRFKELLDTALVRKYDPRSMQVYAIKTNVAQVERMVQALLNVEPAKRTFNQQTKQWETTGSDGDVKIIADDRTNQLIVKATPEQHAEVKDLIEKFDSLKDLGEFKTHVIDVRYANAGEVANMLRQIFDQEQGAGRSPFRSNIRPFQPTRPGQPPQPGQPQPGQPQPPPAAVNVGSVAPEDIIVEDIFERARKTVRIVADDRTNALIVYANDEGAKRVRDMLEVIDKPIPTNYKQFKLQHAQANEIFGLVDQVAKSISAGGATAGRGARGPTVTQDDANNVLHVIADRREMDRIGELIQQLDVAGDEEQRHVVYLKSIKPSEMARIVDSLLSLPGGAGGGPATPGRPGGRRGGGGSNLQPGQQVIPLDAARMLIVNCTEEKWAKVESTIREYDQTAVTDRTKVEFFEILHANPDAVANTVKTLFSNYVHPVLARVTVNAQADGQRLVVTAPEAIMDEIDQLVVQLDVEPAATPLVILALEHADAATAQQYIQNQIIAGGNRGGRGGRGAAPGAPPASVQADPTTNALIVQADEVTLKQIRDFVKDLEARYAQQTPERRFYNTKYADTRDVVNAIQTIFSSSSGGPRGRVSGPSMVKAVQAGSQVMVEAPAEKFSEIEKIIDEMDNPGDAEVVIKTVKLPGADVSAIAQRLNNAFQTKTKKTNSVVRLEADPASETILLVCSRDMRSEVELQLQDYVEAYKGVVPQTEFYQLKNANAQEAATWLQGQLSAAAAVQLGKNIAGQLKVTPDTRTNRVIISAPAVVVEMARTMLPQYDIPFANIEQPPPPVATETRKLPGLDVQNLAQTLQRAFDARPARPDKLKFTFTADPLTSMIVFTCPANAVAEVDEQLKKFSAETADMTPQQKIYEIKNADSGYVREQLNSLLTTKIARQRGQAAASLVNITAEPRLNRVIVYAPKFAIELSDDIIRELDKEGTSAGSESFALKNSDAAQIAQLLTQVYQTKMQQNRQLRIVPNPITNAIEVSGATPSDLEDIRARLKQSEDAALAGKAETRTFVIHNTNPWEVQNALQQKYQQRKPGQRQIDVSFNVIGGDSVVVQAPPDRMEEIASLVEVLDRQGGEGKLVTISLNHADANEIAQMINNIFGNKRGGTQQQQLTVMVTNGELIVRAPERQLKEIQDLVAKVDAPNPNELTVKTYQLKVLKAMDVAVQVQMFLRSMGGSSQKKGQMQPGAFPEATTNTLVVIAPKEQLPFLEGLLLAIESQELPKSEPKSYALTNARAADVATNLQAMLDAKVIEKEGARKDAVKVKVLADAGSNRLFVMAPDEYHDLARDLVKMIDTQVDTGEVVRVVQLANADAKELAQTISARVQGAAGRGQAPRVTVVADAGSNSIVLSGMPRDVGEAQQLIGDLEQNASSTPELQIVKIKNTSTGKVKDTLEEIFPESKLPADKVTIVEDEFYNRLLITTNRRKMRQVEAMIAQLDVKPEHEEGGLLKGGRELHFVEIGRGDAFDIAYDVKDFFPSESDGGPEIDADWDNEYIKVICRPEEYEQIEKLIRQFEGRAKPTYTVKTRKLRGDLAKIAPLLTTQVKNLDIQQLPGGKVDLPTLVEDLWPEGTQPGDERGKLKPVSTPTTPGASGGGKKGDNKNVDRYLVDPALLLQFGDKLVEYGGIALHLPEVGLLMQDAPAPQDAPPQAEPQKTVTRRVATQPKADAPATAAPKQDAPKADAPAAAPAKVEQPKPAPQAATTAQPAAAQPVAAQPSGKPAASKPASQDSASPLREPVRVVQLPDGGISISGDKDAVDKVIDALDTLEEDLAVGQVIKIFRFRFGDVTAAARILELMFNNAGGANAQLQQQMMMQQMQQQAMQQAQRRNQGGDEKDEKGGKNANPLGALGGMFNMGGGRGPGGGGGGGGKEGNQTPLRIATDPSHNYLIVKCDESLLPEIRQLLREMDIKPSNVDVKVIQLKNLLASETANNVKEVLGIGGTGRGGRGGAQQGGMPNMPGGGRNPQQAQMMEIMQQQMVAVAGAQGADAARIDSVQIVPNDLTNSLLISAPEEVMKIIETVLTDLEKLEDRDVVVIRQYPLQKAQVADVLPLLQDILSAAGGGGGRATRGGGQGGGGRGGSPTDLGPVTLSADPRSNTIIYTAQSKDVPLVEAQIRSFDFDGDFAIAESYAVEFGDATAIAQTVTEIFGGGGARRGGGGGGREAAAASGASDLRISAEPSTNTIVVWGAKEMRDRVFDKVEELDKLSKRDFREIPVVFANPEKLAEKLTQLFGGTLGDGAGARRGGGGGGGARGGSLSNIPGRIVIVPDKVSKKLIVRAPDPVFTQMNDLVTKLDKLDPGLQIHAFPLTYADASTVVDTVKSAMLEFMTVSKQVGGETDFDAFTALADPRTNAVMVVGSQETFAFVSKVLETVDVATPADRKKQFRVFVLDQADATVVADAINSYAAGMSGSAGASPQGGGRRGGGTPGLGAGANLSSAPLLDVHAVAEESTNSVLVFGKSDDIETISTTVIERLEGTLRDHRQFARIALKEAEPSALTSFLQPFLDEGSQRGGGGGRGQGRGGAAQGGPTKATIIPNDIDRTLLVRGSEQQVKEIQALVDQFDRKDLNVNLVKVVPVQYGQDAAALAQEVERLVNDGERQNAERTGREPRSVTVSSDQFTNTLLIYGDQSMYGLVETVVKQLEGIRPMTPKTVVRRLGNLSADEAQQLINDLQNRRAGGNNSSGAVRRASNPTGGRPQGTTNRPRTNAGGSRGNQGGGFTPPSNPGGGNFGPPGGGNRPQGGGGAPRTRPQGGGGQPPEFGRRTGGGLIVGTLLMWPLPLTTVAYDYEMPLDDPPAASQPAKAQPPAKAQDAPKSQPAKTQPAKSQPASEPASRRSARIAASQPADKPGATKAAEKPAADKAAPAAKPATDTPPADKQATDKPAADKPTIVRPASKPATPVSRPAGAGDKIVVTPHATSGKAMDAGVEGNTLSMLDHELRGEVTATPMGADTIIITGDEADVAFVEQMLDLLEQSTPEVHIQIFPLQHAKAGLAQQILEQIVQSYQESKGQAQRFGRFSIIAESRSNSLIVAASEEVLDVIDQVLGEIDVDTLDVGAPKLVKLDHIRASEAAAILDPVVQRYNQQGGNDRTAETRVQAIDRSNSLMLIGTPQELAEMEQIIRTIDVEVPATDSFSRAEVLVVDLVNTKAEDLARTLTDLVAADQASGASGGGGAAGGGRNASSGSRSSSGSLVRQLMLATGDGRELPPLDLDRPIKILPEKIKNSLIIASTAKNNAALKEIVGLFDSLPKTADVDVKSFALKHAASKKVAETLDKVFKDAQDKVLARPTEKTRAAGELPPVPPNLAGMGLPYQVAIAEDSRSNSVFVVGRRDAVLLAAGIINELDKPGAELGVGYHVLALKSLEAAALESKLRELLDKRSTAIGGDDNKARDNAVLMVDTRSNSLVVVATDETWGMIEQIATQLDSANSYRSVDTRYRRLKYADSAKLGSLLQQVFDKKKDASGSSGGGGGGSSGGSTGQRDALFALADTRSNSIVLTGTRDYLEEAERMIEDLDQEFPSTIQFKVRPMVLNSASNVASLLSDMISQSGSSGGGGGGGSSSSSGSVQGSPIKIKADNYSNTLLIAASQEDMNRLDRWIDRLDVKPETGRIIRIVPLLRGKAEDIATSAQELFARAGSSGGSSSGGGGGGGGGQDTTISHDKTTNSVIVVGPPAVVNDVVSYLNELNSTIAGGSSLVRIFKLNQASAEDAGNLLRSILEGRGGTVSSTSSTGGGSRSGGSSSGGSAEDAAEQLMLVYQTQHPELNNQQTLRGLRTSIKIIDDVRTNSLVVTAPPESMPLAEVLITAIDVPPDAAKIRVFPLRNADAEDMVKNLEDLFSRRNSAGSSSGSSRGGSSGQATDSTRTLALEGGTGTGGREEITFSTDKRTNSVIAAGTKGYLDLAENMILELDSKAMEVRKQIVYQPRNAEAPAIQQAIADLNEREQSMLNDLGTEISASRKQERQIIAVASEDTNKVLIDYDPRRETQILELVRELDQPPPQVMIQVLIVEVQLDNSLELGAEFALQDLQYTRAGINDTTSFDYVGGTDVGAAGSGLGGFTFTITGRDFNFLVRTLQSEGNLNVLSRPQIIAMDNQQAKIEVTNDVPYVSGSAAVSGQITSSVSRKDVGIILQVTPHINPDGFVRMEIKQEVSDITDSTVDIGGGVRAPIFLKRNAETFVTVKDNETVVLGGLIRSRDQISESKIPILGDIPLLGLAFRSTVHQNRREELLVVLTPRVVRTPQDYQELSREERDKTGNIGEDVLLNPLMQGLRVKPEDLAPRHGEENVGPYPAAPKPSPDDAPADDPEIYGPKRAPRAKESKPQVDPASYDVPVTRATRRAGMPAEARRR